MWPFGSRRNDQLKEIEETIVANLIDLVNSVKTLESSVSTLIADFKNGQALNAAELAKQIEQDSAAIQTVIEIIAKIQADLTAAIPTAPVIPASSPAPATAR
jgi:hypothetical protein